MITTERFDDPRYSRPRYRLRYPTRQSFLVNGYTCGSYKLKRDAQARADELNSAKAKRDYRIAQRASDGVKTDRRPATIEDPSGHVVLTVAMRGCAATCNTLAEEIIERLNS